MLVLARLGKNDFSVDFFLVISFHIFHLLSIYKRRGVSPAGRRKPPNRNRSGTSNRSSQTGERDDRHRRSQRGTQDTQEQRSRTDETRDTSGQTRTRTEKTTTSRTTPERPSRPQTKRPQRHPQSKNQRDTGEPPDPERRPKPPSATPDRREPTKEGRLAPGAIMGGAGRGRETVTQRTKGGAPRRPQRERAGGTVRRRRGGFPWDTPPETDRIYTENTWKLLCYRRNSRSAFSWQIICYSAGKADGYRCIRCALGTSNL